MNVMETVAAPADQNARVVDLDNSPLVREMLWTGLDTDIVNAWVSSKASYNNTAKFMELIDV